MNKSVPKYSNFLAPLGANQYTIQKREESISLKTSSEKGIATITISGRDLWFVNVEIKVKK